MAIMNPMKSVRSTYLYSQLNKGDVLDNNIKILLSKGVTLTKNQIENQYNTINSFYKGVLKTNVLKAFDDGTIKAMAFPKGITADHKIPNAFPFILVPQGSDIGAIAIVDNYLSMDKTLDKVNIDTQKFYTLIETAYVARAIQKNPNVVRNANMYTNGAAIWAHMFTRLLNKKLALNVDKKAFDKMIFLAAKFFLINVLQQKDSDSVTNYAVRLCKNVERISLQRVDQELLSRYAENHKDGNGPYENIATFITGLTYTGSLIASGLGQITVREYLKDFISMYGNAALFGLEHPSYFIFNIFSAINGAFLNNQYAFKDIIARTGENVYGSICNSVKTY